MYELIARRRFLSQAATAVGGYSLLNGLVTPAEAQTTLLVRSTTLWLAEHVLAPAAIAAFSTWLTTTKLVRTQGDGSFHDSFNPGVAFDRPFRPEPTQWTGYLGVGRLPLLSTSRNLPKEGELNSIEIGELQNVKNPNLWYRGRLRLAPIPDSVRVRPTQQELEMMADDLSRNGLNPADYRVNYARRFCDCSGTRLRGFGWSSTDGDKGFRILQIGEEK